MNRDEFTAKLNEMLANVDPTAYQRGYYKTAEMLRRGHSIEATPEWRPADKSGLVRPAKVKRQRESLQGQIPLF